MSILHTQAQHVRHRKRLRAERRFRRTSAGALGLALLILALLLSVLGARGVAGLQEPVLTLPITFTAETLGETPEAALEASASTYRQLAQEAVRAALPPESTEAEQRAASNAVSFSAGVLLKDALREHPEWLSGTQPLVVPFTYAARDVPLPFHMRFDTGFFASGDSRSAEQAGFLGAMVGSLLTVLVCLAVAFPLGVMTAVYLEEFARPGKWTDLIEVNINNLAAVPSIVFGLLGLSVFLLWFGVPRSAPLAGGLTLSLMVLPVMIISTRAALRAVPASIRHAALALGATPLQAVWHQVLPLAIPGIMTGTILAVARALGETAPLLMIGMVAFVADVPSAFTDPATAMPVQIYLWAGSPEVGFAEKAGAGIMVLLGVMLALNAAAIYIRRRFEVRW